VTTDDIQIEKECLRVGHGRGLPGGLGARDGAGGNWLQFGYTVYTVVTDACSFQVGFPETEAEQVDT
jgi:hypothetical protein